MQCPNCGAQARGKFCEYCGSQIPRIAPETVNNDNSKTTIINNYYQAPSAPRAQSINRQSFKYMPKPEPIPEPEPKPEPKIPIWKKTWFVFLICALMPYIGIFLLWPAKKPKSVIRRILVTLLLVFYTVSLLESGYENQRGNQKENNSIWLDGYTDISDFKYYIDGNEIFLTDFHSSKKKVRINSSYDIDGNTYQVVSLDGVFTLDKVTSVIIPEGVRSVAMNEFKSCGVTFLYLPSTLQDIGSDSFWGYFHNVEKIYYGGSEEQWNQLCTVERSEIDAKQIIFDANPDDFK